MDGFLEERHLEAQLRDTARPSSFPGGCRGEFRARLLTSVHCRGRTLISRFFRASSSPTPPMVRPVSLSVHPFLPSPPSGITPAHHGSASLTVQMSASGFKALVPIPNCGLSFVNWLDASQQADSESHDPQLSPGNAVDARSTAVDEWIVSQASGTEHSLSYLALDHASNVQLILPPGFPVPHCPPAFPLVEGTWIPLAQSLLPGAWNRLPTESVS